MHVLWDTTGGSDPTCQCKYCTHGQARMLKYVSCALVLCMRMQCHANPAARSPACSSLRKILQCIPVPVLLHGTAKFPTRGNSAPLWWQRTVAFSGHQSSSSSASSDASFAPPRPSLADSGNSAGREPVLDSRSDAPSSEPPSSSSSPSKPTARRSLATISGLRFSSVRNTPYCARANSIALAVALSAPPQKSRPTSCFCITPSWYRNKHGTLLSGHPSTQSVERMRRNLTAGLRRAISRRSSEHLLLS
mmetsp:Transcript_17769/g.50875  ORF Transcript_17769/g.50875 Transcript_17769/m.50875 type:complete len:249 (+) Transcript_17769:1276-2022(+)